MKFKETKKTDNDFYNEIRFNKKTTGKIINIIPNKPNPDKKKMGLISILSLMTVCGNYDKAVEEVPNKNMTDIISKMIDNAKIDIGEKSVKL